MTDYELMGAALEEAAKAAALGEVPVGAVVARDGEIIAAAHNTRETGKNALHHAELLAIDAACKKLGGWRLWQCDLFVTLEPCPMCSGGIINSRIRRVVYGAADPKAGCCGSVTDLFALPFNHHPVVESGLRAEEAQALLQQFFLQLREKRAAKPRWKPPVQLFSLNCAILFNGNLSKPHAQTSGLAAGPALTGEWSRAQPGGAAAGKTFLPVKIFAGREQATGGLTLVR